VSCKARPSQRAALGGRLKWALLLKAPEAEVAKRLLALEQEPLF
jgi:hypothetical protein